MSEQGYSGWANYPTWNVALWINNDQGAQESVFEALRQAQDADDANTVSAHLAGKVIREWVEAAIWGDEAPASMATDLLGWALDMADWTELGAAFLTDLSEQS